jgi:hypothetical protein
VDECKPLHLGTTATGHLGNSASCFYAANVVLALEYLHR